VLLEQQDFRDVREYKGRKVHKDPPVQPALKVYKELLVSLEQPVILELKDHKVHKELKDHKVHKEELEHL
jgi:hypothetical protein